MEIFGQNMVLFVGAMMSVDASLYEAAELDGANKWQQFKYIMLPSIKTIVMLNLIMSITGSLSAFEPPFVIMSGGGNGTANNTLSRCMKSHIQVRRLVWHPQWQLCC